MVARNPYSFFKKAICYKLSFTPPTQRGEPGEKCLPVKLHDRKYVNDFEIKARSSYIHLNCEKIMLSS